MKRVNRIAVRNSAFDRRTVCRRAGMRPDVFILAFSNTRNNEKRDSAVTSPGLRLDIAPPRPLEFGHCLSRPTPEDNRVAVSYR